MAVIFLASATPDLKAVPLAQRVGVLPQLLGPDLTNLLELLLRKGAHLFSFGVLALLARHALASGFPELPAHRRTYLAFGFAVLYAITDEWHQSLAPTRDARATDVLIDAAGAAVALWVARKRSGPPAA